MNAAVIAAKLKSKGQAMTLTRTSAGTFDPVTGGTTGATSTNYTVYGITGNYSGNSQNSTDTAPNSLIRVGDKKVMMGAGVIAPLPGDTITIMTVPWIVISVDEISPQGVVLLYTLQVRK